MPSLAHDILRVPDARPERCALFVHGILGTKANWRGIARQFVKARPHWAAVTVDLPMHGDSQGFTAPWTVAQCGEALAELIHDLDLPTELALGHSFGGKVVTDLAMRMRYARPLEQLWIIDSPPGLRDDPGATDSQNVISKLRTLPDRFASRQAFGEEVMRRDLPRSIATWLAMNLRRVDDHFVFPLNLEAIEALLHDYFRTEMWSALDELSAELSLRFSVGAQTSVFLREERERLDAWGAAGKIGLEVVEDAGHWVHAEKPDRVLAALVNATG